MSATAAPTASTGVLADRIPGERVRDALLIVGFAALIGASAQVVIPLPFTPVPITGQTFAVLLGAASLGTVRATAGTGVYLGLGLAGVPWFTAASAASFGYIIGFIAAAAVVGALASRGADRTVPKAVGLMVVGNLVIYAFGVTYLAIALSVGAVEAIGLGLTPFLIGDLAKIALAAAMLPLAWRMVDGR